MFDHIQTIIEDRFGRKVLDIEQIHSGNNRVLKLHCDQDDCFIAKVYPHSRNDSRDRLGVEFGALSFLWKHGIRTIPKPLYADRKENIAIYEFVHGFRMSADQVDFEDVSSVVEFVRDLASLREKRDSFSLPAASEACFSYQCYLDSIHRRLKTFETLGGETLLHKAAREFLYAQFVPSFKIAEKWYHNTLSDLNLDVFEELTPSQRTLSPSDFGFHNAIRRPDNRLVYVDFEYFGWDDPAKMISDFLHHPALPIPEALKSSFLDRALPVFDQGDTLAFRIRHVYPILGLKWCLIMLNEFLPGPLERRRVANISLVIEEVLNGQLKKAQDKLNEIHALFETSYNICVQRQVV